MNNIKIGTHIRTLRQNRGITQAAFANILCVTPQAVSKWERNESYPDITILPVIANFFEVSIDLLFGR